MNNQQPVYIINQDTQRTQGKDAQRNNIMAAKLVAETVRTTLGPKGMDKMLVDSLGDVIVTNDGVTILKEMQIEHPVAKMIVEVAKTQENEVGDGTTTAVVFAGELLKNAEILLDKNVHPTVITKGYSIAAEKSIQIVNSLSEDLKLNDKETLKKIAMTAMTGKKAEIAKEILADLCASAVMQVAEGNYVNLENIKVEKKVGDGTENSELIQGIVLDKEKVHSAMPRKIDNAKILLLDLEIEVRNTEIDAKIQITDPSQLSSFIEMEENMIRSMVEKIKKTGSNVLFCQKGIDDLAQHYLAKAKIFACRRVKKSDLEKLAMATGGSIVSNLDDMSSSDLGFASSVEEKKVGDEEMTYVTGCKNPKAVTILVRGGTEHVVDEIERGLQDALGDLRSAIKSGKVVTGAGSVEIEIAHQLRSFANTLSGREQLAVLAFAESMEIIPRTLAENAGLDPIDSLTELKAAHEKGQKNAGLNVFTGKLMDAKKEGIIEPLNIKIQALKSATEVAELILRIDDILLSGKRESSMPPQGGMPGMM